MDKTEKLQDDNDSHATLFRLDRVPPTDLPVKVSDGINCNHRMNVPKLTCLAATRMHKSPVTSPMLPHIHTTLLTHDHNAFLCSLFNKIDLDKEKEMLGPFSTSSDSEKSIISDAVEQHKPVGGEDLPEYNDTISSMVINAQKKVFKPEYDKHSEVPVCTPTHNFTCLNAVDKIRRMVYNTHAARNSAAPYSIQYHRYIRGRYQEVNCIVEINNQNKAEQAAVTDGPVSVTNSEVESRDGVCLSKLLQPSCLAAIGSSARGAQDNPPPIPLPHSPLMRDTDVGPLRVLGKRPSSGDGDCTLSRNQQRLFEAVSTNNVGRAEVLLTTGASEATVVDGKGRTSLHIAAAHGYTHLVRLLLQHGADPNCLDSIGNRPLDLALSGRQIHVAAELILAGTNAHADKDAAITALSRLARQMLSQLQSVSSVANVHTAMLYQSIRVLQHSMSLYEFTCPEVKQTLELLEELGLTDPNPPPTAVEELCAALSKSLYFDR